MVTHRMLPLLALAVALVSCAAPRAPTTAPTPSAPPAASPTQAAAQTIAPTQSTLQIAIPTQAAAQTAAPTQTAAQTAIPTKAAAQPTGTAKLNIDEIFPPGPGREAVLDNCTSCHTIVPIVVLQMSQSQWDRNARDHRGRVPRMSDADFKAAYDYLAKNFNPDRPVPKLPKELLDTWTDY